MKELTLREIIAIIVSVLSLVGNGYQKSNPPETPTEIVSCCHSLAVVTPQLLECK